MTKPDPALLDEAIPPRILDAMRTASEALSLAGVRHAVTGGIAVAANGYPRTTNDVHFLVGAEAFQHHPRGVVTLRHGVPFQVNGVAIDFLSSQSGEEFLEAQLDTKPGTILEAPALVYLKLKSSRLKDQVDVIELVKASIDIDACRTYLATHAPDLVPRFDALVARAEEES